MDREEGSEKDIGGSEKCVWNAEDEVAFVRAIEECSEKGKPLPTYAFLCNHAKNVLGSKYSYTQLYNKLKRLKRKFKDGLVKMEKPSFSFGSPHEEMLFRLFRKIWGEEVEGIEENEGEKNNDPNIEEENEGEKNNDPNIEEENEGEKNNNPNIEEENELDLMNKGDQNVGKDSAAHAEDMMLYASNAELNRKKIKVSASSDLIDFIRDVIIENMDSLKEYSKGLLEENKLALSKLEDELLAGNENE
ncbi:hypothetical protein SUGI_0150980 [Cryptomeria japonica]|uniref:probable transcription factor At3g04930 n=1 Tax=Cryptomeria japonica TaxID=3369 RepID=UPI002408D932|nr:probable transcription factor At3g04930 [Cryptomeria japonica]GLJ11291.1 hypothetical protein SUGI_0150980 [Cryptomeria japonica]